MNRNVIIDFEFDKIHLDIWKDVWLGTWNHIQYSVRNQTVGKIKDDKL